MESLAELIPAIYSQSDTDGSLAKFVSVYDQTHAEQIEVMETLQTVRIPSLAPLAFIPDIADALGSPFPFMTADRWKRGNKLDALPFIYSLRGSQQGIQDTILYLTGIPAVVEVDVQYSWILGQRYLSGSSSIDPRAAMVFIDTADPTNYYSLSVNNGAWDVVRIPYVAIATPNLYMRDIVSGTCYLMEITSGAVQITQVPNYFYAVSVRSLIDSGTGLPVTFSIVNGTFTIN